jgi:hypothetical protein
MFRYLDSNQDNRIQSSASCQLLNTGLEATDINSVLHLLLPPEYRSRRSGAKHWARHGSGSPAFDLAVEVATSPEVEVALVALANVLTHGLRVVALEHRPPELAGLSAGEIQPESLGRLNVCGLMYVHAEYQVVAWSVGRVEELQEKSDQRRVAVDGASIQPAARPRGTGSACCCSSGRESP